MYEQLKELYPHIYDWLTTKTLGGYSTKSNFQYYNKVLWLPLRDLYLAVKAKERKTTVDEEFLACIYTGKVFRIHNYSESKKGYIKPYGLYQSWASHSGLDELSRYGGMWLLICGELTEADIGFDTFALLTFMARYQLIAFTEERQHPKYLIRYEDEHEVAAPLTESVITDVRCVESANLTAWEDHSETIPKELWFKA